MLLRRNVEMGMIESWSEEDRMSNLNSGDSFTVVFRRLI